MLCDDFPPSSPLTPRESSSLYIGGSGGGKSDLGEEVVWET